MDGGLKSQKGAAQKGNDKIVHWLLMNGADVNSRDDTGKTALGMDNFQNI